jgi:hypothetical protein
MRPLHLSLAARHPPGFFARDGDRGARPVERGNGPARCRGGSYE